MDKNIKQNVALHSVFASATLTIIKFAVGITTGSIGILSEAAHSLLDLGAASLTYFAVRIADKPPDLSHPYGHSKVESVSALIETGLLFLTSAWIIYESLKRMISYRVEVEVAWYSFAVIILSIIIDFSRSRALKKVARETNSQALEADALHFSSDILSSLVVLIGLIFVFFGVNRADAVAALGVSFFVLRAGYQLGKRTIDVLVDAAPQGLMEKIKRIIKDIPEVLGVEKIRVRPAGAVVFVDMTIDISRKFPLEKAHEISNAVEKKIRDQIANLDITIHTKPLALTSETIAEQVQIVATNHGLSVHDIAVHKQEDNQFVSFDLEVDAGLTVAQAHKVASHLEETIQNEIGNTVVISTHIEPFRSEIIHGELPSVKDRNKLANGIELIVKKIPVIKNCHEIQIRVFQKKFFITIHCQVDNYMPLEKAHELTSRLEYLIKDHFPKVQRVVVHIEPEKTESLVTPRYRDLSTQQ